MPVSEMVEGAQAALPGMPAGGRWNGGTATWRAGAERALELGNAQWLFDQGEDLVAVIRTFRSVAMFALDRLSDCDCQMQADAIHLLHEFIGTEFSPQPELGLEVVK